MWAIPPSPDIVLQCLSLVALRGAGDDGPPPGAWGRPDGAANGLWVVVCPPRPAITTRPLLRRKPSRMSPCSGTNPPAVGVPKPVLKSFLAALNGKVFFFRFVSFAKRHQFLIAPRRGASAASALSRLDGLGPGRIHHFRRAADVGGSSVGR